MSKHIPGPLAVDQVVSDDKVDIILAYEIPKAGSPILIASVTDGEGYEDLFTARQCRDTAKRLAACYSACEGIDDLSIVEKLKNSTGRDHMREELKFLRGLSDDVVQSYEKFELFLKGRIDHFGALHRRDLEAGKMRGNGEMLSEVQRALEAFREFFLKKDPRVPPAADRKGDAS